jgi:phage shock protein C
MTETSPKKIYRRSDDRIISGTSSGIAMYFNIDPVLVRIAWVLLFFVTAGFPTILGYLLAWWLIPDADGNRSNAPLIWLVVLILLPLIALIIFVSFVSIVSVETSSLGLLLPLLAAA